MELGASDCLIASFIQESNLFGDASQRGNIQTASLLPQRRALDYLKQIR
jgi:hypothetical protein